MKIIIASSNPWFRLEEQLNNDNEILFINKKSDLTVQKIKRFNPKFIFFTHWSWKVSSEIYLNYDCILFHTAPLPFGKGGSPIQNLILRGYKESPVCAVKMIEKLDSGPIYGKKNLSLEGPLSLIFEKLNLIVNDFISELIINLPEPIPQKGEEFFFKRLNKNDNWIPIESSLLEIFNRIRMLDDPSYPSAKIKFGNFTIEFENAEIIDKEIKCEAKIKFIK